MNFNSISGIVRDGANQEVANATVALIKQSGGSIVEYTTTDINGFYEFTTHAEANATEENWHVAVYDQDAPIFNSFSKPYVAAALNLSSGEIQSVFTPGGSVPFTNFGSYQANFVGSGIVTEINVEDGVTPVAYSNLVAWWPFDPSIYGPSYTDDVTSILNPSLSGSSANNALDVFSGASHVSSGGVTNVDGTPNSGYADATTGHFDTNVGFTPGPFTWCGWLKSNEDPNTEYTTNGNGWWRWDGSRGSQFGHEFGQWYYNSGNMSPVAFGSTPSSFTSWRHYAVTNNSGGSGGSTIQVFVNGSFSASATVTDNIGNDFIELTRAVNVGGIEAEIDDWRIYDTVLSSSEINQIYQNTRP